MLPEKEGLEIGSRNLRLTVYSLFQFQLNLCSATKEIRTFYPTIVLNLPSSSWRVGVTYRAQQCLHLVFTPASHRRLPFNTSASCQHEFIPHPRKLRRPI
jgi:hypothetical protein